MKYSFATPQERKERTSCDNHLALRVFCLEFVSFLEESNSPIGALIYLSQIKRQIDIKRLKVDKKRKYSFLEWIYVYEYLHYTGVDHLLIVDNYTTRHVIIVFVDR